MSADRNINQNINQNEKLLEAMVKVALEESAEKELLTLPSNEKLNEMYPLSASLNKRIMGIIKKESRAYKRRQSVRLFTKIAASFAILFIIGTALIFNLEGSRIFILNTLTDNGHDYAAIDFGGFAEIEGFVEIEGIEGFGETEGIEGITPAAGRLDDTATAWVLPESYDYAEGQFAEDQYTEGQYAEGQFAEGQFAEGQFLETKTITRYLTVQGVEVLLVEHFGADLIITMDTDHRDFSLINIGGNEAYLFDATGNEGYEHIIMWSKGYSVVQLFSAINLDELLILAESFMAG